MDMNCSTWQVLPQPFSSITDDFKLGEVLGSGSFGVVRACESLRTGEKFACKLVWKDRLKGVDDCDDVRREVEALRHLGRHDSVVGLRHVYEDYQAVHIVMQLCDGGDLLDAISGPGSQNFSETEASVIFYQVVEAVAFCHANGWAHRDIKPDNIMFVDRIPVVQSVPSGPGEHLGRTANNGGGKEGGTCSTTKDTKPEAEQGKGPKVVGLSLPSFGLGDKYFGVPTRCFSFGEGPTGPNQRSADVCRKSEEAARTSASSIGRGREVGKATIRVQLGDFGLATRVRRGEVLEGMAGSSYYLSPEMLRDDVYGIEADVWGLGVVLYALLSHHLPFRWAGDRIQALRDAQGSRVDLPGDVREALYQSICRGKADTWTGPWKSVSDSAKELVHRMLTVDPHRRISASEILHHRWMRQARESLRPELAFTITRSPAYLPLVDLRKATLECSPGLGCLAGTSSMPNLMSADLGATSSKYGSTTSLSQGGSSRWSFGESATSASDLASLTSSETATSVGSSATSPDRLCPPVSAPPCQSTPARPSSSASQLGSALRLCEFNLDYRAMAPHCLQQAAVFLPTFLSRER